MTFSSARRLAAIVFVRIYKRAVERLVAFSGV